MRKLWGQLPYVATNLTPCTPSPWPCPEEETEAHDGPSWHLKAWALTPQFGATYSASPSHAPLQQTTQTPLHTCPRDSSDRPT